MRPTLRPGLQILRRDLRTLQLGFDWPGVAIVRDGVAMRAVLAAIDGFRDARGVILAASAAGPDQPECEAALTLMVESGAVVDQAALGADGAPSVGRVPESTWAAWWLLAGPGGNAATVHRDRASCPVLVRGDGLVADEVRRLLAAAHVPVTGSRGDEHLVVMASDREPSRDQADDAMHGGLPHLWVCVRDLVGLVGPFVIPGVSACLRCVDLSLSELDPAWPTLLASAAAQPVTPPPCDDVHVTLVAALATQEVLVWASKMRPQTCDRVIEVPHGFGSIERGDFPPHPQCGCGWSIRTTQ